MANENSSSGGVGFCGLLTITFIVLKLCGVIAWSWLWVLSPTWIPFGLLVVGLILYALFSMHKHIKESVRQRRIKEIMKLKGMNEWAARREYYKTKNHVTR